MSYISPSYPSLLSSSGTGNITIGTTTVTTTGTVPYNSYYYPLDYSELSNLSYDINFSYDKNNNLNSNISSIVGKTLIFNCNFCNKNRLEPYELIMKMIKNKTLFNITIDIEDKLTIKFNSVIFKKIENNFNFDDTCSFDNLRVKMKYKDINYINHKLDISEKRKDKLKKIMKT